MASIEITGGDLIVHIHGWDKLLALRSTLTIPLSHVTNATACPADAQYDKMKGLRIAGGYWPGSFAAGYFWVTGGAFGGKQEALDKLESALAQLEPGTDDSAGGPFGEARGHVERAISSVKQGLAASKLPELSRYMAFYDIHDPTKTIGLDVEHGRLRRVVVEIDDETPEATVERVTAAIQGAGNYRRST